MPIVTIVDTLPSNPALSPYDTGILAKDRDFLIALGLNNADFTVTGTPIVDSNNILITGTFVTLLANDTFFSSTIGKSPILISSLQNQLNWTAATSATSQLFGSTKVKILNNITNGTVPGTLSALLNNADTAYTNLVSLKTNLRALTSVNLPAGANLGNVGGGRVGPFSAVTVNGYGLHERIYTNNITAFNLSASNVKFNSLSVANLTASNAFISNLTSTAAFIADLTANNTFSTFISATSGYVGRLSSFTLDTNYARVSSLTANTGIINSLSSLSISATNGKFINLTGVNISATNISADNAFIKFLSANNSFIADLSSTKISATSGIFIHLTGVNISATNISATTGSISNLSATNLTSTKVSATSGIFTNLSGVNLTANNVTAIGNIYANNYYLSDGTTLLSHATGGSGGGGTSTDYIDTEYVNIVNIHYPGIPGLSVTEYGDGPVAVFKDVSGHPEYNFNYVAAGGYVSSTFSDRTDGESFAFGIDNQKYLWRAGSNFYGQLGTGDHQVSTSFSRSLSTVNQIATKGTHVAVLSTDNTLLVWGNNQFGQIGTGTYSVSAYTAPVQIGSGYSYVAAGSNHTLAIKNNTVYAWGRNVEGQLGIGTSGGGITSSFNVPQTVSGNFKIVVGGANFTLALDTSDTLWGWGSNANKELGLNIANTVVATPTQISNNTYSQIAAGIYHGAAITTGGELYIWGNNGYGQIGNGTISFQTTPLKLTIPGTSNLFKSVACGYYHTAVVTDAGDLYVWGNNEFGQIGNGTTSLRVLTPTNISPSLKFVSCAAGKDGTYAITTTGDVYSWGNNTHYQLNLPTVSATTPTLAVQGQVSAVNVAMYISGTEKEPGFVGIKTDTPNVELTVNGDISANGFIIGKISAEGDSVFNNISANSIFCIDETVTNLTATNSLLYKSSISALSALALTANNISAKDSVFELLSANNILTTGLTAITINSSGLTANSLSANNAFTANLSSTVVNSNSAFSGLLSASNLTIDTGTVSGDLTVFGKINGNVTGNIITTSINTTDITAKDIYVTDVLGIGTTNYNLVTSLDANMYLDGNAHITGRLSAYDSLYISNSGSNTCLNVYQSGNLDVAKFYYSGQPTGDYGVAMVIRGHGFRDQDYAPGYVGIRTEKPNEALTVAGNISASGNIYTGTGTVCARTVSATNILGSLGTFNTLNSTLGTFTNLSSNGFSANNVVLYHNLTADKIYANEFIGTITNTGTKLTAQEVDAVYLSANNADIVSANISSAFIPLLTSITLTSSNVYSNFGKIVTLSSRNITVDHLIASIDITTPYIQATTGVFVDLTSTKGLIPNLTSVNLTSTNILASDISATHISADVLDTKNINTIGLTAVSGLITNLTSVDAFLANLTSNDITSNVISASQLTAIDITSLTLNTSSITAQDVSAVNISSYDVTINHNLLVNNFANINLLSAGEVDTPHISAHYAEIDLISTSYINALTADINLLRATDINVLGTFKASTVSATNLIGDYGTINNDLNVGNDIHATGDIYGNRIYGTIIGPTVSVGTSIDVIDLSAQRGIIDDLTITNILNAPAINVAALTATSIVATDTFSDNITAHTLTLFSDAATCLTVSHSGVDVGDVAVFKYSSGDTGSPGDSGPSQVALVIKGNQPLHGSPDQYNGGFVGIKTDTPNVELTVNGQISANNQITSTTYISAGSGMYAPEFNGDFYGGNGFFNNLFANYLSSGQLVVDGDIQVNGTVYGNYNGSPVIIPPPGTTTALVTSLSAHTITTDDLIINNKITTSTGDSDLWTSAYFIPVTINLILDGMNSPVTTDAKGYVEIPYDIQLQSWSLFADQPSTNTMAVSVLATDFNNYPASTPIYGQVPFISIGSIKNTSTDLTGWNSVLSAGTILSFGASAIPLPGGGTATPDAKLLTLTLRGLRK